MSERISDNTKAILLLTAPLLLPGSREASPASKPLSHGEYVTLACRLRELGRQPAELLGPDAESIVERLGDGDEARNRIRSLLSRGLQLGHAIDGWRSRSIWVCSRADPAYPTRLKVRFGEQAPAILYGCGDHAAMSAGGLAVVGSRNADEGALSVAAAAGETAACAAVQIVSGGARGVDASAMVASLERDGRALGVLADSLERAVVQRVWRGAIADGRLTLITPYDPAARFLVGHAMARNKSIYALADVALVVESERGSGGTWAGAVEQLERWRCVPIYVRSEGSPSKGLDALRGKGARAWPHPDADGLRRLLAAPGQQPAEPASLFEVTRPSEPSPKLDRDRTP